MFWDKISIFYDLVMKVKNGKVNKKLCEEAGADFKNQFTYESYKEFIKSYAKNAEFMLVDGKMPCAIAVINKV